jgi:hypothetical protein
LPAREEAIGSLGMQGRTPTDVGAGGDVESPRYKTLEERRAFILETATRLFASKGYAGASVDDIARELGVSKARSTTIEAAKRSCSRTYRTAPSSSCVRS